MRRSCKNESKKPTSESQRPTSESQKSTSESQRPTSETKPEVHSEPNKPAAEKDRPTIPIQVNSYSSDSITVNSLVSCVADLFHGLQIKLKHKAYRKL